MVGGGSLSWCAGASHSDPHSGSLAQAQAFVVALWLLLLVLLSHWARDQAASTRGELVWLARALPAAQLLSRPSERLSPTRE